MKLKIAGQPCAPSLAFDLGDISSAAKALMIRRMLARGFMVSVQFYVMFAHDEALIDSLLNQLAEVFSELSVLHADRRLASEAGNVKVSGGFARLA